MTTYVDDGAGSLICVLCLADCPGRCRSERCECGCRSERDVRARAAEAAALVRSEYGYDQLEKEGTGWRR